MQANLLPPCLCVLLPLINAMLGLTRAPVRATTPNGTTRVKARANAVMVVVVKPVVVAAKAVVAVVESAMLSEVQNVVQSARASRAAKVAVHAMRIVQAVATHDKKHAQMPKANLTL